MRFSFTSGLPTKTLVNRNSRDRCFGQLPLPRAIHPLSHQVWLHHTASPTPSHFSQTFHGVCETLQCFSLRRSTLHTAGGRSPGRSLPRCQVPSLPPALPPPGTLFRICPVSLEDLGTSGLPSPKRHSPHLHLSP